MAGLRQVADAHGRQFAPSARAAAGHHGNMVFVAAHEQQHLVRHVVNGIKDEIEFQREQFDGGLRVEKFLLRRHAAVGIDGADAFGHHLDLGAAHGFGERVELAVDVGHADFVQIHERQRADAGTRQRLRRPRAHAADADDTDVRGAQFVHPPRP